MDYTVVWSGDALDDIDALAEYIARDSVFYARGIFQMLGKGMLSNGTNVMIPSGLFSYSVLQVIGHTIF